MFGFERLTAIGRAFERAVQSDGPEVQALADSFAAAIEATIQEILRGMEVPDQPSRRPAARVRGGVSRAA